MSFPSPVKRSGENLKTHGEVTILARTGEGDTPDHLVGYRNRYAGLVDCGCGGTKPVLLIRKLFSTVLFEPL